jgi:hypothetical protein
MNVIQLTLFGHEKVIPEEILSFSLTTKRTPIGETSLRELSTILGTSVCCVL